MPNKNHSKSDKKTRKYKQRRAQLLAEVAQLKKETEKLNKESAEQSKKSEKEYEELRNLQKETGKEIKEVVEGLRQVRIASEKAVIASEKVRIASKNHGKRIGRIGNNLGRYTEAMAMPSIRGILERDFGAEFKGSNLVRNTNNGLDMEVDAWGVSRNGTGAVYVVEIKRKFHDEYIKQIWRTVKRFRVNQPEYRAWAVYPMLAVVDISKEGRAMVWNAGIHLIEINDGVFRYAKPPQGFEADGYHGMSGVRKDVPHLRAVPG